MRAKFKRHHPNRVQTHAVRATDRSGFTIVEMVGTCILLGGLFTAVVPMFLVIARERHSAEQRQFAIQHAANLLEHASAVRWSDLAAGAMQIPEPSGDTPIVLPGIEQSLTVTRPEGELDCRQITATVRWKDRQDQWQVPLVVSTWVYQTDEVSP